MPLKKSFALTLNFSLVLSEQYKKQSVNHLTGQSSCLPVVAILISSPIVAGGTNTSRPQEAASFRGQQLWHSYRREAKLIGRQVWHSLEGSLHRAVKNLIAITSRRGSGEGVDQVRGGVWLSSNHRKWPYQRAPLTGTKSLE